MHKLKWITWIVILVTDSTTLWVYFVNVNVVYVVGQPHKCTEKGCRRRFTHEHDLKKHLKAHDGEEHYCPRCNYSNPDERLLKQHMNKHLKIPKYFCKNCGKGHIYSMQLKRHNDKGC